MEIATLDKAIEAIVRQKARWGFPMQPPCPEELIMKLSDRVENTLGGRLPAGYLQLLQITDGIAENALTIYARENARDVVSDIEGRELEIPGIVEENQFYRLQNEAYHDLILFARREEYQYAQFISTGEFIQFIDTDLDRPPRQFYDTFDEMMIAAIATALVE